MKNLLAGVFAAALLVSVPACPAALAAPSMSSWADIVERVSPSVVSLKTKSALGSGFVIDGAGFIVTNNHVVRAADDVDVTFSDGSKLKGRVVGRDEATDIALIRVMPAKSLAAVRFEDDKNVRVGDLVLAVGNPFGLGGTATAGIVSARGRDELSGGQFTEYLQLDAPINPGNSGGPTFDVYGRVVGMNTQIQRDGNSIGFAVPSSTIQRVAAALKEGKEVVRGFVGIQMATLSEEDARALGLPNANGALVSGVIDGSPAAAAGIRTGDVILKLNGQGVKDARELARRIGLLVAGQKAVFLVWREGAAVTLTLTVAARDKIASSGTSPGSSYQVASLGMALQTVDAATRDVYRLGASAAGVLVLGLDPSSEAAVRGLRPGDRIVAISNAPVASLGDVNLAMEKAKAQGRGSVVVFVETPRGLRNHVTLPLD